MPKQIPCIIHLMNEMIRRMKAFVQYFYRNARLFSLYLYIILCVCIIYSFPHIYSRHIFISCILCKSFPYFYCSRSFNFLFGKTTSLHGLSKCSLDEIVKIQIGCIKLWYIKNRMQNIQRVSAMIEGRMYFQNHKDVCWMSHKCKSITGDNKIRFIIIRSISWMKI